MASDRSDAALLQQIREYQSAGEVAELFVSEVAGRIRIEVRAVGTAPWLQDLPKEVIRRPNNDQHYYFMSDQLRPGSGIIRSFGGKFEGPGGTLTCFLSSKDGRDRYFAAAGHVLSNFWNEQDVQEVTREVPLTASVFRYQKGFPGTGATRFLGKLTDLSPKPQVVATAPFPYPWRNSEVTVDIGIVKLRETIEGVQRTTCYGSFGEWTSDPDEDVQEGQAVMKCGAEETHWTYAVVLHPRTDVTVYGPGGVLYELRSQVILQVAGAPISPERTAPPAGWSAQIGIPTFAVPGDSGTMIVDQKSKRPVGMLIAGSILDGLYVMTPIRAIWKFWQEKDLVFLRG
jgi:hypothetical protein